MVYHFHYVRDVQHYQYSAGHYFNGSHPQLLHYVHFDIWGQFSAFILQLADNETLRGTSKDIRPSW